MRVACRARARHATDGAGARRYRPPEPRFDGVDGAAGAEGPESFLDRLAWILPERPLGSEMGRVLSSRDLRGADLWHVACALYLADHPPDIDFVTLDTDQREAARALGFGVPD